MNLAVITSGFLPVPATKGGAVENLVENLLNENEKQGQINFNIFSVFDEDALIKSKNFKKTKFIFIKINALVKIFDKVIFFIAKNILRKKNSHSYRFIIQRLYFLRKCSNFLKINDYDKVLLENHPSQYLALKWHKNYIKYCNRYYYHCHNEFPSEYGCHDIIKNTNKIICVSEFRKKNVMQYLNLGENKFCVLKNGIDMIRFKKKIDLKKLEDLKKKYQ